MQRKTFEEINNNVFKMMKSIFGDKSETELINEYEKEILNKGKGNPKFLHTLNEIITIRKDYKNKKLPTKYAFESLRKDSVYLIESLIEFAQRRDLGLLEKTKVLLTFRDKHAELYLTNPAFLIYENKIRKITNDKIEDSTTNEFNNVLSSNKGHRVKIDSEMLNLLKKELGEFNINL